MGELPKRYQKFHDEFPHIANSYETLGDAVHNAGPLDNKTRALIKLAISIGSRLEGGVHAHTRKALKAGCTPDEIKHTVMLALPTMGLPSTMAAYSWVEDVINNPK
jgi:AhpD family alkylhydroperoxidase